MNTETNNTNNAVAYNNTFKFDGARVQTTEKHIDKDGNDVIKNIDLEIGEINASVTIDNAGWVENLKAGVTIFCCMIKEAPGAILPIVKLLIDFAKCCKDDVRAERAAEREERNANRDHEAFERNMNRAHEIKLHELKIREIEARRAQYAAAPEED